LTNVRFGWKLAMAEVEALKARLETLETICAQSYQVVGSLASDLDVFEQLPVEKALDNLSEMALTHEDVLPFPSYATGDRAPGNLIENVMAELCFPEASGTCVDRVKHLKAELEKTRTQRDQKLGAVGYAYNRVKESYYEAVNNQGVRTNGPLRIPVEASLLSFLLGLQPKEMLPGYKVLKDTTEQERAWLTEAKKAYLNNCVSCLRHFTGLKNAPTCKVCSEG